MLAPYKTRTLASTAKRTDELIMDADEPVDNETVKLEKVGNVKVVPDDREDSGDTSGVEKVV